MIHYLRPSFWKRAFRDPLTWLALAVDAVPIIMVIFFGWGAAALVLLYWAENIVIGIATLGRIIFASIASYGMWGVPLAAFMFGFFTLHYGLFCFGHGIFIFAFAKDIKEIESGLSPGILLEMFQSVVAYKPHMALVLTLMAFYQGVVLIRDYWPGVDRKYPDPLTEMFSPYGRIVVLHIGIFAGAFALLALGDPMIGVLGLIVFRMGMSVFEGVVRDKKKNGDLPKEVPVVAS